MPTALLAPQLPARPLPGAPLLLEPAHGHVSGCYWDVAQCRWSCRTGGAARVPSGGSL